MQSGAELAHKERGDHAATQEGSPAAGRLSAATSERGGRSPWALLSPASCLAPSSEAP